MFLFKIGISRLISKLPLILKTDLFFSACQDGKLPKIRDVILI